MQDRHGARLFDLVQQVVPPENAPAKVTGMLLELDEREILHLLDSPEALRLKVDEAVSILAQHPGGSNF